jgi:hypothetical protein
LDVRVTLVVEDGQRIAYVRCMVDDAVLPVEITNAAHELAAREAQLRDEGMIAHVGPPYFLQS